jgi:trk system potassium uptake protein TrkA
MHIIIVGAGAVGSFIASTLCTEGNKITIIDTDKKLLNDIQEHLDVMTVHGNGAMFRVLEQADITGTDLLIAVSGSTEANILACQTAKHFQIKETICRVSSKDYFSENSEITPEDYGITKVIYPTDVCAKNIVETIIRPHLKEVITFDTPGAIMVSFAITINSPIHKVSLQQFPNSELLNKIRFCAISRRGRLIIPRGDTVLRTFDEVYISGELNDIEDFVQYACPNHHSISTVVISGVTPLSTKLVELLNGIDVSTTIIEQSKEVAEQAANYFGEKNIVICGDATDTRILDEAGINQCDAFISTVNDEISILNCLLAKRQGAKSVYALANKTDYLDIISGIPAINAGFSTRVDAVNELLTFIRGKESKVAALLKRIPAEVIEFEIPPKGKVIGKPIKSIKISNTTVIAMIIRDGKILSATGELTLLEKDRVIVLTSKFSTASITQLLGKTKLF